MSKQSNGLKTHNIGSTLMMHWNIYKVHGTTIALCVEDTIEIKSYATTIVHLLLFNLHF
jgi:hypothetical protein